MLDAIYASFSGLQGQQLRLDTVSNNLANVNTPGFKKSRINFADLVYRPLTAGSVDPAAQAALGAMPDMVGLGSRIAGATQIFSQGDLRQTDRPLDLAIQGQGFFEVERADGSLAYTRLGSLKLNELGELVTQNGLRLSGALRVPSDATACLKPAAWHAVTSRYPSTTIAAFFSRIACRP